MASSFATVIVLYRPTPDTIAFCREFATAAGPVFAIVNEASAAIGEQLQAGDGLSVVLNGENRGLAVAFNQGITAALAAGADYVMLLDQDSRPPVGLAAALVGRAELWRETGPLGAIGPVPRDRKRPDATTLPQHERVGDALARTATIISSGMTIHRDAIAAAGGMWDELFIDQVDHEWCFRSAAAGYPVALALDLTLDHNIGDAGLSVGGRYKPIHRSPVRHYHIVRNTLWLARLSFIPWRWRCKEVLKLGLRIPAYIAFSGNRAATIRQVVRGLIDGFASLPPKTRTV